MDASRRHGRLPCYVSVSCDDAIPKARLGRPYGFDRRATIKAGIGDQQWV
jgi:hypothetical protein